MTEHEEQVERDEEQSVEDEAKEALRKAVEQGHRLLPRSESIPQEVEPLAEEPEEAQEGELAGGPPAGEGKPLDLNTASEQELRGLPGIGPTLAGRIVRYREEEGSFRETAEITRVQGISEATYEALAGQITVVSAQRLEAPEVVVEGAVEEAPEELEEALVPPEEPEEPGLMAEEGVEEAAERERETVVVPLAAEEAAETPPPLREEVRRVQRPAPRGAGWGSLLVVGLLSTLAGAFLALLVLFLLNGSTLDFERATIRAIDREVSPLQGQLSELGAQLESARQRLGQLDELSRRLGETQSALDLAQADIGSLQEMAMSLQSELAAAWEGLADVRQTLAGLSDDLTSVAESVTALDEQVAGIEERLGEVDEQLVVLRRASARFDTFLVGLQQLLEEIEPASTSGPMEETPAATPWLTPTPTPWLMPTSTPVEPSPTPASRVTVIPLATPTP